MKLELSTWTHHLTHLLYSYFYFCKHEKLDLSIVFNEKIAHNGALLEFAGKSIFFDYSDDSVFIDSATNHDFYFKRSLKPIDKKGNVYPLNFNVPMSYKSYEFLLKLNNNLLTYKPNKMEVLRALDKFGWFTNSSHGILDIRKYPKTVQDLGGKVIFHTRLWNPDNHPDPEEKKRRILQNDFRVNACKIIKKKFKNASVGLYSDDLSKKMAPDIILDNEHYKKKNYLNNLKQFNIGVADDGLKNNPGWKIGEYLFFGKAVITTPLKISLDNFKEGHNFEKLSSRSSFEDLPDKIENLLTNNKYLEVGENNLYWSSIYLHPKNYIRRILSLVESELIKK